jgi:hypothetical protein
MTARSRRLTPEMFAMPDPMADAVFSDTMGVAGELSGVLDAISGFDQSTIKGIIFRKPPGGLGRFEWIEEVAPPIDMSTIMSSLKARFGGGEYRLQIFAGGKTRKVIEFPIMNDPTQKPGGGDNMMGGDFMKMFMMQQAASRAEQMEYARQAAERQERAAERQQALLGTVLAAVIPALIPVLSGANREKLSDIIALMQQNKPESTSLKDTVEMMVAVKGLLNDDNKGGDFNPDDIVGSIARIAGPTLAAAGRAFGSGRNGGGAAEQAELAAPAEGQLILPPPNPAPAQLAQPVAAADTGSPVLNLIRPHVLYFFSAHLDPGLAAEAIADIMEREGVAEDDVRGLVAAFTLSADWKADLAGQGLDLRGDPVWADEFLAELVAAWTERDQHGDGGPGRAGGVADAEDDADPLPPGGVQHGGEGPGA